MVDKFVLVVSDEKDDTHGEISVLDAAQKAERLVETLLEARFEQNRIRVFAGSEAEFETIYRPVVSLTDEANQTTGPDRSASDHLEPEATEIESETEGEAHSGNASSMSSLFRSARDEKHVIFAVDSAP